MKVRIRVKRDPKRFSDYGVMTANHFDFPRKEQVAIELDLTERPGVQTVKRRRSRASTENGPSGLRTGMTLREMEKELILKTLAENDGNRTKSAGILGITRRSLQNKLKEYEIEAEGREG